MAIIPDEFGLLRHANNLDARAEQFRRLYGNMLMYGEDHAQADGRTADALRSAAKLIDSLLSDRARNAALASEAVAGGPCLSRDEQRAQGARCACRGSDDYCPCQNAPDRQTIAARTPTQEKPEGDHGE